MKFFTFCISLARGVFLDALAMMLLWNWFVHPLGAPVLSYWQAVGLDTLVGLPLMGLIHQGTIKANGEASDEDALGLALVKVFIVGVAIGTGAIAHLLATHG